MSLQDDFRRAKKAIENAEYDKAEEILIEL